MAKGSATLDITGLRRLAARLDAVGPKRAEQVVKRAASTLSRRMPVEAARMVSDRILNTTRTNVRPLLSAQVSTAGGSVAVTLSGLRKRVPLNAFIGAKWAGPESSGAVVKVWRDSPAKVYDRSSSRKDTAVFAIKGRGVRGGLYQRVRNTSRAPIVLRKGPELWRAITDRTHGDIYPDLIEFGRSILSAEIDRLLKVPA